MNHTSFESEDKVIEEFSDRFVYSNLLTTKTTIRYLKSFISQVYRSAYEQGKKEERERIFETRMTEESLDFLRKLINKQN